MKLKSKCFVLVIILCILFSISAVSAADNQTDILNQDSILDDRLEVNNDDLNEVLEATNESYDKFYEDIKDCTDTFNIESNYVFNEGENNTQLVFNQSNLIINGKNHIIDGSNFARGFVFKNNTNITINGLTFRNCDNAITFEKRGNLTLNNVNFTNNYNFKDPDYKGILEIQNGGGNLILNKCNFNSNINSSFIYVEFADVIINNSHFYTPSVA